MRTLVAILLVSAGAAQAATIEYRFAGTVEWAGDNQTLKVKVGDTVTASFVSDLSTPDLAPTLDWSGSYNAISATLTAPHLSVTLPGTLGIHNDHYGSDSLRFVGITDVPGADQFTFYTENPTGALLANDALPSIAQFRSFGPGTFGFYLGSSYEKFGGSAAPVPEPSSLFFVMLGLALTIRRRSVAME